MELVKHYGLWIGDDGAERRNGSGLGREVERYPYLDETGKLLFEVIRFEPKTFRPRRPDGAGGWIWNLEGTERVLYRLPEVLKAAKDGGTVYVVEGEKDADALRRAHAVATCNPGRRQVA